MEHVPIYKIAAPAFSVHTSFLPPYQMHQRPTHSRLHVRDVRDALILLEAVRLGILKPVLRRLNDAERSMYVRSGSVFVWEESDDDAGIKRWTDGCMWSQSRMREPFLFYEEKLQEDRSGIASKSRSHSVGESSSSLSPLTPLSPSSRALSSYPNPPHSPSANHSSVPQAFSHATISEGGTGGSGLVKQAYSAYVTQPGTSIRKKFHLTAYFTYADLPNLPTLDSEPSLSNIVIPQSVYRSGKSRTSGRNLANAAEPMRTRQQSGNGIDSSPSPTSSPSSIDHPSLNQSQWAGGRRGSAAYLEPSGSESPLYPNYYASSTGSHPRSPPPFGNTPLPHQLHPQTHTPHDSHSSFHRLPPVASFTVDTESLRRIRNSEDDRVINMLNSRPIP